MNLDNKEKIEVKGTWLGGKKINLKDFEAGVEGIQEEAQAHTVLKLWCLC